MDHSTCVQKLKDKWGLRSHWHSFFIYTS